MKFISYYTLLIYILSLILSCSESKDRNSEKSTDNITDNKDSIIYTLDDTLIAHASVLNEKAYGILKSKLLKFLPFLAVCVIFLPFFYQKNIRKKRPIL